MLVGVRKSRRFWGDIHMFSSFVFRIVLRPCRSFYGEELRGYCSHASDGIYFLCSSFMSDRMCKVVESRFWAWIEITAGRRVFFM